MSVEEKGLPSTCPRNRGAVRQASVAQDTELRQKHRGSASLLAVQELEHTRDVHVLEAKCSEIGPDGLCWSPLAEETLTEVDDGEQKTGH